MGRQPLTLAYRGNFQPDLPDGIEAWSTEHHIARSFEQLGHTVIRCQEDRVSWQDTVALAADADLFVWTQTYGYALNWDRADAVHALRHLGEMMPTAGVHLDLWWGLDRQQQIREEPFFQDLQHVFTADGDHADEWAAAGVNHHWLPPAVFGPECQPGTPGHAYTSDIAFVGSWRGGYHDEWWPHRRRMLDHLRRRYRRRVAFWPKQAAVRGRGLNDLYASVKVVVGDSCFADRSRYYFSDRPFETVGRGGFLVMPWIEQLAERLVDGEHCRYFQPGDLSQLSALIDHYLDADEERERIRKSGQEHVANHHTYAHRMAELLDVVGL